MKPSWVLGSRQTNLKVLRREFLAESFEHRVLFAQSLFVEQTFALLRVSTKES